MTRDFRDYINDIAISIEHISKFIEGLRYEDFFEDIKTSNAAIRSLEVIGEAAKSIPDYIRRQHPDIPWKQMAGMRDKLIHQYFGVDLKTVWIVCSEELPPLLPKIERIREEIL